VADQNLSISVRADASKLRADLALAQARVRALGTDLRNAANESLKTGNTAPIRALADGFEQARANVANLRAELNAVGGSGGGLGVITQGFAAFRAGLAGRRGDQRVAQFRDGIRQQSFSCRQQHPAEFQDNSGGQYRRGGGRDF
jgi:hypothetical protein